MKANGAIKVLGGLCVVVAGGYKLYKFFANKAQTKVTWISASDSADTRNAQDTVDAVDAVDAAVTELISDKTSRCSCAGACGDISSCACAIGLPCGSFDSDSGADIFADIREDIAESLEPAPSPEFALDFMLVCNEFVPADIADSAIVAVTTLDISSDGLLNMFKLNADIKQNEVTWRKQLAQHYQMQRYNEASEMKAQLSALAEYVGQYTDEFPGPSMGDNPEFTAQYSKFVFMLADMHGRLRNIITS